MPRPGQIIPMWLHPHEEVYINDNSRYEDIAFQNNGPTFLNVFMSRKGVDNKLQYFNSVADWVNEFGLPDFRRYGQPGYNAYVSLSTGLATSQSMRIMPKDATHANVVLVAKYMKDKKIDESTGETKFTLHLKFVAKTFENVTDENQLEAAANSLEDLEVDEEGYLTLPIMTFWSRGRGLYGNDYRVRISHDKGADKDNSYVNYTVELLTMENGTLEILEAYNVSFFIDAIDPNSNFTLFVNDVIDDAEGKGSKRFNVALNYDNLEKIFDKYVEIFEENNNPELIIEKVKMLPLLDPPDPKDYYATVKEDTYQRLYKYMNGKGELHTFRSASFTAHNEKELLFEVADEALLRAPNKEIEDKVIHLYPINNEVRKSKTEALISEFFINDLKTTKVYRYDKNGIDDRLPDGLTNYKVTTVESFEGIAAVAEDGQLYKAPNLEKTSEGDPKFIVYKAKGTHDSNYDGEQTRLNVVEYIELSAEGSYRIPEGMRKGDFFMSSRYFYNINKIIKTCSPESYVLYAPNDIIHEDENYKTIDDLNDLQVAEPGVIYELTKQDDDKDAGTQWVAVVNSENGEKNRVWATPEEPGEPEPLLYDMGSWDIFGYNKFTKDRDPMMTFDGGLESISVLSIEGLGMESGSDGSFGEIGDMIPVPGELGAKQPLDKATRDEAIEQAYLAAFNGEFDKAILSKRRAPVDLMLDANYPISVKKAMVALAQQRYDAACHLDTNLLDNLSDLEEFYNQIKDLQERLISFDAHMFRTSDPITGKAIPVTITLWLASKLPQHFNVYGNHTPLAGEEYGALSGYKKNSIRPIVDADDTDFKEKMYAEMHMNYIECIAENTYIRGTQQTSQNFFSDLSEENNMLVLLEIKRKIERLAFKNRYKWADPEELRLFQEACKEIFSSYQNTKCKTLDIVVKSNKWEKTRYIVHVYLAVTFRTFQKRALIEIDVNPRA